LYHLPTEPDFGVAGCGERPGAELVSTKVLHEPEGGKPAITLTTYKDDLTARESSATLLQLFKPFEPSPFARARANSDSCFGPAKPCHTDNSRLSALGIEEQRPELTILRAQLGDHFQGLKSEFEVKTGRTWIPLTPWGKEDGEWEWEWEGEGDESDEVGLLDVLDTGSRDVGSKGKKWWEASRPFC
jgi:hypothetical protein